MTSFVYDYDVLRQTPHSWTDDQHRSEMPSSPSGTAIPPLNGVPL